MSIEKMRPAELHNQILLKREKCGVDFYLKNYNSFIEINCPSCAEQGKIEFYKYGYSHLKCEKCKTLYVSPRPSQELLFEYYSSYEAPTAWNDILIETNNERKYLQHIPRVEKLHSIMKEFDIPSNVFVDLGAGNGNFAKAVLEANIFNDVVATDISDSCIDACKKQGLQTIKCTIDEFNNSSIDCITFNDLIEHVFDPYAFVLECYSKLNLNGILMLSTPNGEGFDFKILKEKTENITPPEHIQYFNPHSIKVLLEKVGFEIVDISTPGILDAEIIKRQRNEKQFELNGANEFLDFMYQQNDAEIEKNFQDFLQKSNLSSHMLVFARKAG